jgi:hypothetical protein
MHKENTDNRPTAEIIDAAYSVQDEEEYWHLIALLHERGSKTEFLAAKHLACEDDQVKREVGADILGQLGWAKRCFHDASVAILIQLLSDSVSDVIASAAFSLGHRNDPTAIPHLLQHIQHLNARVRHGVVLGLSCHDEKSAISGLITLSEDFDFDVRNWATFGLGSQCDMDTVELRRALLRRADDDEAEIRGEALIGLANRKDERVKERIIRELSREFFGNWAVEAAEVYPDKAYLPLLGVLLQQLGEEDRSYFFNQIKAAVSSCRNA